MLVTERYETNLNLKSFAANSDNTVRCENSCQWRLFPCIRSPHETHRTNTHADALTLRSLSSYTEYVTDRHIGRYVLYSVICIFVHVMKSCAWYWLRAKLCFIFHYLLFVFWCGVRCFVVSLVLYKITKIHICMSFVCVFSVPSLFVCSFHLLLLLFFRFFFFCFPLVWISDDRSSIEIVLLWWPDSTPFCDAVCFWWLFWLCISYFLLFLVGRMQNISFIGMCVSLFRFVCRVDV